MNLILLNSNVFLYKITLHYVTFAEMLNGKCYVIAVDYNSYVILEFRPSDSSQCKYVPYERIFTKKNKK